MPKYYVESGELRVICEASCYQEAAIKALEVAGDEIDVDGRFYIDERGFRGVFSFDKMNTSEVFAAGGWDECDDEDDIDCGGEG